MKVLVTGGAGYLGSHACVGLIEAGHEPVIVDNLDNSDGSSLDAIFRITGMNPVFYHVDVRDGAAVSEILARHDIDAVMHFAAKKAVEESIRQPVDYWDANVSGSVSLVNAMQANDIYRLVYSSSATVYGVPERVPITEEESVKPINPYGQTKATVERFLQDVSVADSRWTISNLRYFNPIGCHPSGLLKEAPKGRPANLVPHILEVISGRCSAVKILGGDYPTPDGTGVRDYIHVVDLIDAHIRAISLHQTGFVSLNIGTGTGYSVLDVIRGFEMAAEVRIKKVVVDRRPGDVPICYADATRASAVLGWYAKRGLSEMCADALRALVA